MKKILFYLFVLNIIFSTLYSQRSLIFVKNFGLEGYDRLEKVIETCDNGFVIIGSTQGNNFIHNTEMLIAKFNQFGDIEWRHTFGRIGSYDVGVDIFQLEDRGYIIAGNFKRNNHRAEAFILKMDSLGNQIWRESLGDSTALLTNLHMTKTSGFIFAGYRHQYPGKLLIGQIDIHGSIKFECEYPVKHFGVPESICQKSDSSFLILYRDGTNTKIGWKNYLLHIKENGDIIWEKCFGDSGYWSQLYSIIPVKAGGYLMVGKYYRHSEPRIIDGWIIKVDADGKTVWDKKIGTEKQDYFNSVIQTKDNGFAMVGTTSGYGSGGHDIWFVKTDSSGRIQWEHTYGGPLREVGKSIHRTFDGGYMLTGETKSYSDGKTDIWIVKTDSCGKTAQYGLKSEQEVLFEGALLNKSKELLKKFIINWRNEIQTLTKKELNTLPSEIKESYIIYELAFNEIHKEWQQSNGYPYLNLKNLVVPNAIIVKILDETLSKHSGIRNIEEHICRTIKIENFRPRLKLFNAGILYLNQKYRAIIGRIFGTRDEYFYDMDRYETNKKFLSVDLIIYGQIWEPEFYIQTYPLIRTIYFNKEFSWALFSYLTKENGDNVYFEKMNGEWIFKGW